MNEQRLFQEQAVKRWARRQSNGDKGRYAVDYFAYRTTGGQEPGRPAGLSFMMAEGVRNVVDGIMRKSVQELLA